MLRLFAAVFRRQMGKVMTVINVIYARMPRLLFPQMLMVRLSLKGLSLEPTLVDLVQIRVSIAHGCAFCTDLHRAAALRSGRNREKLRAVDDLGSVGSVASVGSVGSPPSASILTPRELAALAMADAMARGAVPTDGTFEAARAQLGERGVVELVWLCAFTGYLNAMARTLRIGSDDFCALVPAREVRMEAPSGAG
jgi:AhpD family alkylhydroperoxidase